MRYIIISQIFFFSTEYIGTPNVIEFYHGLDLKYFAGICGC
jgi:hypothetical protein